MNLVPYLKDHLEQALMLETVIYNEWLSWLLDSAFFTKVPKVQNIDFQFMSDPAPLETMDLSFAWEELHHLTMEYDHQDLLGRIFQGLHRARKLKSLRYVGQPFFPEHAPFATTKTKPEDIHHVSLNIDSLIINMIHPAGFYGLLHNFFSPLTIPFLTSLEIVCTSPYYAREMGTVVDLQ
ncbi:hypothetical protein AAF712_009161, partial [Marasmius tenuissimus]